MEERSLFKSQSGNFTPAHSIMPSPGSAKRNSSLTKVVLPEPLGPTIPANSPLFIERVMLRPLVNQDLIILFMATIGLNYFIEGFAQLIWGSHVGVLDLGVDQYAAFEIGAALINKFDVWAALIAGSLVLVLSLFFRYTVIGRALRAVADDHQAALSVGIPLSTIWIYVWSTAGLLHL